MLGIKRKQVDDDWGLVDSSSGTDTDSSNDEEETSSSVNEKRLKTTNEQQTLTRLPHELLCEILILSSNPYLPTVCRTLAHQLLHCPDSVKIAWLLFRCNNDFQASFETGVRLPLFTTGLLYKMDALYQTQQLQQQQHDNTDIDIKTLTYTKKKLPVRLFDPKSMTNETDDLLRVLLERGGSPDRSNGFPLIKSAQLGDMHKVKLLIKHGADPTLRNNLALRACSSRNNMDMTLYFLDQLNVKPNSETLKPCVARKLWKMVQVLVDHGAVPDIDTVNLT